MYNERVPLELFVAQCFQSPQVIKIASGWRIDNIKVQAIISDYIRELGIEYVTRNQRQSLMEFVKYTLQRSSGVQELIKKAESEENERRRSRHADV